MSENKNAKTPTDSGVGFIDGVWYGPGPTAWRCQCGRPYTVTCISSKPPKRKWVGLPESAFAGMTLQQVSAMKYAELVLKEKNT